MTTLKTSLLTFALALAGCTIIDGASPGASTDLGKTDDPTTAQQPVLSGLDQARILDALIQSDAAQNEMFSLSETQELSITELAEDIFARSFTSGASDRVSLSCQQTVFLRCEAQISRHIEGDEEGFGILIDGIVTFAPEGDAITVSEIEISIPG